jgi:hypothetical protein
MSLFETKQKSDYLCPRCNGTMFVCTRPVNVVELKCEDCDSVLSPDYVQGWHDGRKFQQPALRVETE